MATRFLAPGGASTHPQGAGHAPSTITKTEEPRYDEYRGPLADLIAAGLVRQDQLLPPGKATVSWRGGLRQFRNGRRDENYLRVVLKPRGQAVVVRRASAEAGALLHMQELKGLYEDTQRWGIWCQALGST